MERCGALQAHGYEGEVARAVKTDGGKYDSHRVVIAHIEHQACLIVVAHHPLVVQMLRYDVQTLGILVVAGLEIFIVIARHIIYAFALIKFYKGCALILACHVVGHHGGLIAESVGDVVFHAAHLGEPKRMLAIAKAPAGNGHALDASGGEGFAQRDALRLLRIAKGIFKRQTIDIVRTAVFDIHEGIARLALPCGGEIDDTAQLHLVGEGAFHNEIDAEC